MIRSFPTHVMISSQNDGSVFKLRVVKTEENAPELTNTTNYYNNQKHYSSKYSKPKSPKEEVALSDVIGDLFMIF